MATIRIKQIELKIKTIFQSSQNNIKGLTNVAMIKPACKNPNALQMFFFIFQLV
jgi:hypothetical protein